VKNRRLVYVAAALIAGVALTGAIGQAFVGNRPQAAYLEVFVAPDTFPAAVAGELATYREVKSYRLEYLAESSSTPGVEMACPCSHA
jgi:hypothetical protein